MVAIQDIENEWYNLGISFFRGSNMNKLMLALSSQLDRITDEVWEIYEQQKIETATGPQLEKLGRPVGVRRRTGEDDATLRARIQTEYRIQSIEGTTEELIEFMIAMLDADEEDIEIFTNYDAHPGAVFFAAQKELYDQSQIGIDDIQDFADRVVPAGHRVELETLGTFRVTDDDTLIEQGHDPDAGLTSDEIETGGTLAEDVRNGES